MATPANNAAVLSNSFFLMECFLFTVTPCGGPLLLLDKKTSLHRLQFRSPTGNAAASRRPVPADSLGTQCARWIRKLLRFVVAHQNRPPCRVCAQQGVLSSLRLSQSNPARRRGLIVPHPWMGKRSSARRWCALLPRDAASARGR